MKAGTLFTKRQLKALIIPLLIEQVLSVTIGLADVVMIASAGEAAVSGVSLVDMLNVLILNVFAALGTGGAVVSAQFLGAQESDRACQSAKQLLFIVFVLSLGITAVCLSFQTPMLRLAFGEIEADVLQNALIYFKISALSYPFLAVYNASAALFRAQGNSRVAMLIAGLVNFVNIGGNALLIFGLRMGVAGAALSSLMARVLAAVVMLALLRNPLHRVSLSRGGAFRPDSAMIGRILRIGIPNGLENSLFQLGRVMVVGMIATFGTTQIAANAVANNLDALSSLPGQAMSLAIITVVGQCVGARDFRQARYYARHLMKITYIAMWICNLTIVLSLPLSLRLYDLSAETLKLAAILVLIHCLCAMAVWPLSFTLPNVLRASNDVRYTMVVSIFSMFAFRIAWGYLIGSIWGLGAIGIWIAMVLDWIFRAGLFSWRYQSGKWIRKAFR